MKTFLSTSILLFALVIATIVNAQTTVTSSGSSADNVLTKWVGAGGNEITNSQVYDDGANVGIGTVVPVSKLTVQNGSFIDPGAILNGLGAQVCLPVSFDPAGIGIVVTSSTAGDLNLGVIAMSRDGMINIGIMGKTEGGLFSIGTVGMVGGDGLGVMGTANLVDGNQYEGAQGVIGNITVKNGSTLGHAVAVAAEFDVDEDTECGQTAGTITDGIGIYIEDVPATNSQYGVFQEGSDDINFFNGFVGVGTSNPAFNLDVAGTAKSDYLRLTQGAGEGFILQSTNTDGDAAWVDPATVVAGYWTRTGFGSVHPTNLADRVSIGTNDVPAMNLHVQSDVNAGIYVKEVIPTMGASVSLHSGKKYNLISTPSGSFEIQDGDFSATRLYINLAGSVGIGTTAPRATLDVNGAVVIGAQSITSGVHTDFQLAVDGKVVAKEYVATLNDWADFVFTPGYRLPSINEVEQYIKANGHLPSVPSAAEVQTNGMNVAEMNVTLLQKIEELTLYIIEQNKRIEQLESQLR